MAKSVEDCGLWLPSQFLTAQDMHGDKENDKNGGNAGLDAALCFPSEFPYEFDSFGVSSALSSPVESVAGSTETESSDEDDFFAGLTRRLSQASLLETWKLTVPSSTRDKAEKTLGVARSPQSTLSGIGSWSGRSAVSGDGSPNGPSQVPSPPTTPFSAKISSWDVIYAAAGEVARLKVNGEVSRYDFQNRELLGPPRAATPFTASKAQSPALYPNQSLTQTLYQTSKIQHQQLRPEQVQKQQCASDWGRQAKTAWLAQQQQQIQTRGRSLGHESVKCVRPLSMPQSAWTPLQSQPQNHQAPHIRSASRGVLHGGSTVKRGCAGTGVFLPRQYGNPPEPCKKTSCPPVLLPAKVIHALNLNIEDLNAAHSRFSGGFVTDYDALLARRNALLMQQRLSARQEEAVNHELRLPQEWTY
ncbi:hypothetical protein L6164_032932 [Bauhinia variegata]|uniref:Uncharacterized protein n=1 Tax=Bauhinia variegata TaxID=167791 RepID=A0ACB9KQC9_BAUVA|nr:hypothetical protein L6164_032932 [Bauhinia variegata]